jgi:hypothetical protein
LCAPDICPNTFVKVNGTKNVVRIDLRRGEKISQRRLRVVPQECLPARDKLSAGVKRGARSDKEN